MSVKCQACNLEQSSYWIKCVNCNSPLGETYDTLELNSKFRIVSAPIGMCLYRGGILVECVPFDDTDLQGLNLPII